MVKMAEIVFLPNDYASPGIVVGHPDTCAMLQVGFAELQRQIKLLQAHAKNALDKLPERYNMGFQAGLQQAIPYEKELTAALKAEKDARATDNADLTAQIMTAEEKTETWRLAHDAIYLELKELKRELAALRGGR